MLSWRYPPIGVSIHPLHGNPALQGLLYSLTVTDHGGKFFPPNPLIEIVPQNRQGFFVSGSVQGIPFSFSPARVSPTTYRPHLLTLVVFCWWPSPPVYLSRLSFRVPSDERPAPQKRTSPISEKVSCTACTKKIFYLPKHFPHCGDIKNNKQRKKHSKM